MKSLMSSYSGFRSPDHKLAIDRNINETADYSIQNYLDIDLPNVDTAYYEDAVGFVDGVIVECTVNAVDAVDAVGAMEAVVCKKFDI